MASVGWAIRTTGDSAKIARAHAEAITGGIRSAVNRHKGQVRRQAQRAGMGVKLPKAFRGRVMASTGADITRRGVDADPTGATFSKAIVKRGGAPIDLFEVFEHGATIQAKGGPYLAVPAKTHPQGRKAKALESLNYADFRVVPVGGKRRGRPAANRVAFLVIHRADNVVWYLLVKTVRLRKRLRAGAAYVRIARTVQPDIERRFARALVKAGVA